MPPEKPFFEADGIESVCRRRECRGADFDVLRKIAGAYLKAHLTRLKTGDYFALLAYLPMTPEHEDALQAIRRAVRDAKKVATCLGFGPRFLHSTGQAYKGGPNSGVFLQITCDDSLDLAVPGQKFTFGVVKAAQARGDFQVLADRHRRALRLHFASPQTGLAALSQAVLHALG